MRWGSQQRFQLGLAFYKKTYLIMIATVVSGLLNFGLNFLLIPKYGYMAAAVTTLVSYAFLLATMVVISRRYFIWDFPFKTVGRVACASAIMGAIVYFIGSSLTASDLINSIVGICIGVVIYLGVLFLLREPQKDEIQVLNSVIGRILGIVKWSKKTCGWNTISEIVEYYQ